MTALELLKMGKGSDRLEKTMGSSDTQPTTRGDVLALSFNDPEEEAAWIAEKIETLYGTEYIDRQDAETRGLTYSDMAALLRSVKNNVRPIIKILEDETEKLSATTRYL